MMRLAHLEACFSTFSPTPGLGICFHLSAALCLDFVQSEIVFGSLIGDGDRFIHAWVERNGHVYAPTTIGEDNRLAPMGVRNYYAVNQVEDARRLSRPDLLAAFRGCNLPAFLTKGRPLPSRVSFVPHLLDAAGVRWMKNEASGVVPWQEAAT